MAAPARWGGMSETPQRPGDQPGPTQAGEVPCPDCHGSGKRAEAPCPTCQGSGMVRQIVGDA
jgi:DnaJ-class molecular chaperone